jgi:hypothetical protein
MAANRAPAAWTDQWIRELSWREIQRIRRSLYGRPVPLGIVGSRMRRLEAEWERRKREGGGGWGAQVEREQRTEGKL